MARYLLLNNRSNLNSMKTTETKSKPQTKTSNGVAEGLRELFEDELKDIYWAEKALVKAMPKMIKNASSEELIAALEDHLSMTEEQVARAEQVFEVLGLKPQGKKCEAMAGLIKEAEEIMKETKKGMVRDAGIISAAQKIEHYEIATYGTLRTFALTLEEEEAADLLQMTLDEEKDADSGLTDIAEAFINAEAV
jgi:ferritin-like metal-binding protein YciE